MLIVIGISSVNEYLYTKFNILKANLFKLFMSETSKLKTMNSSPPYLHKKSTSGRILSCIRDEISFLFQVPKESVLNLL